MVLAQPRIWYIALACFFYTQVKTQTLCRTLVWKADQVPLLWQDSLPIIPSSIECFVNGVRLDSVFALSNTNPSFLKRSGLRVVDGPLTLKYCVLPGVFIKPYQKKSAAQLLQPKESVNPSLYQPGLYVERDPWSKSSLEKSGSISRGISFGNSQDLSVSSNLNLQLSGKLSDEIQILAAITDQNIPIQAEGNTQQLQDFDQVFIQFFTNKHKLIAGDYVITEKDRQFLRYNKKAQGLSYQFTDAFSKDKKLSGRLSGAASRGKFARHTLAQQEGNQGPYRLLGADNELFIIILSGTERVFIDGELLTRGVENDYIIDYNTAEIIFMPKRLITKDKRIVIEFQYSDRQYVRTLADAMVEYENKGLKIYGQFFTEQDHKNQPVQEDLSPAKKLFLQGVGDNISQALYPSADTTSYNPSRIAYEKLDSLGYEIFKYSLDSTQTLYQVVFSLVGEKRGNYVLTQSSANGKVFDWIAPDTLNGSILPQGNYEPIELLITPKQKQLGVLGLVYKGKKHQSLVEWALSKQDLNTYSDLQAGDDVGMALKVREDYLDNPEKAWQWKHHVQYEYLNKNFREIEWFRSTEFLRDWNLSGLVFKQDQHILQGGSGVYHHKNGKLLEYQAQSFQSKGAYQAIKHQISSKYQNDHWILEQVGGALESTKDSTQSTFLRHKSTLAAKTKYVVVGIKDDLEHNVFSTSQNTPLLQSNSYQFLEGEVFIRQGDSLKNKYQLSYLQRSDKHAPAGVLTPFTHAESVVGSADLLLSSNFNLKTRSTYRYLQIKDVAVQNIKPEKTLLNRVEYSWRAWKNSLQLNAFYELGSGVEARREYTYIEVPFGQGIYSWNDYNQNGLRELNEFEMAAFQDQANYIRIFTPSTQYLQTKNNQISQSIYLQPERVLNKKSSWAKVLAAFSDQFSYQKDWKSTYTSLKDHFNPLMIQAQDTQVLGINALFKNSLFVLRSDPRKGLTFNYQKTEQKLLSNNGFEYKNGLFWEGIVRIAAKAKNIWEIRYIKGEKQSLNDFFSLRNYQVNYYTWEPSWTLQWNAKWRSKVSAQQTLKRNIDLYGGQQSKQQKIQLDNRWSMAGKTNIETQFSYIYIDYSHAQEPGALNSAIAFEMLEGLKPGQNMTWSARLNRMLPNQIQLTLQYNGRASGGGKIVHVGGAEVRAFF